MALKRLVKSHTRSSLQTIIIAILDYINDVLLTRGDVLCDESHGFLICYGVPNTDTKTIVEQLVIDNHLDAGKEEPSHIRPFLAKDDMDQTTLRCADHLLLNNAEDNLAFPYCRRKWD
jgi:hypothetical protein